MRYEEALNIVRAAGRGLGIGDRNAATDLRAFREMFTRRCVYPWRKVFDDEFKAAHAAARKENASAND